MLDLGCYSPSGGVAGWAWAFPKQNANSAVSMENTRGFLLEWPNAFEEPAGYGGDAVGG